MRKKGHKNTTVSCNETHLYSITGFRVYSEWTMARRIDDYRRDRYRSPF